MLRRFSKRLSGKSFSKGDDQALTSKKSKNKEGKAPSPTNNVLTPQVRTMTTANLFSPSQTTAAQSTAMDRTLYEIPQPEKVDAMTDLIKDHTSGELFPYVGIVGTEGESSDARRARMLALKPSYNKRDIPEIKILGCPLISREGDFTMETLMSFATANSDPVPVGVPLPRGNHSPNYTITKPYVHIRQVTILYSPNVSSTSNYCRFWMNLVDNRLIDSDKGSQTNVVVSNQEGILEMSCDYCVSIADLASFTLSYTLERDIVHPGFQWGTASFYFSMTESDLPYQSSKVDAMAVYRMPITTLMDRQTNADKSDISFTPADLVKLRQLYSQGDIVDVDQPQKERQKTNAYSKSSVRRATKGEAINVADRSGWEYTKGAVKPKVDAFEASVDPDDSDVPEHEFDQEEIDRQRKVTLDRYKKKQERARQEVMDNKGRLDPVELVEKEVVEEDEEDEYGFKNLFEVTKPKKQVRLSVGGV